MNHDVWPSQKRGNTMKYNWDKYGGSHPTGISETREFIRADNTQQTTYGCVVFAEEIALAPEPCMPTIALAIEFASNAKRIRVTVDILE